MKKQAGKTRACSAIETRPLRCASCEHLESFCGLKGHREGWAFCERCGGPSWPVGYSYDNHCDRVSDATCPYCKAALLVPCEAHRREVSGRVVCPNCCKESDWLAEDCSSRESFREVFGVDDGGVGGGDS